LLGFVFGIPRSITPTERGAAKEEAATSATGAKVQAWRANTNLEEVSDWLTKIIVGLSLVHLHEIETRLLALSKLVAASVALPQYPIAGDAAVAVNDAASAASAAQGAASAASASVVDAIASAASAASAAASAAAQKAASAVSAAASTCTSACAPSDAAVSVAMALIICMTAVGFLLGYLYTRLFLPGAFVRSERDAAVEFKERLRNAQVGAVQTPQPPEGGPVVATTKDIVAAQAVAQAVPADRPDLPLRELIKLCAEYDQLRIDMPAFSHTRTRKMSDIVSRMKPLTTANRSALDTLAHSSLAGERLAATVMLLMQFDPNYIDWLAARLSDESAFIGFQAASALLARMTSMSDESERQRIAAAVEAARARIPPDRSDKSRDALIDRIISRNTNG
jgi:hypothetical protein